LPAKVVSRNFLIEWLILLPYFMAMISLDTVVAFQWLAGAKTRPSYAATCPAKRGSINRAH
jgi:hypothetical protein